jgi:hypothetical protein
VVDAYTRRIFSRHGFVGPDADYEEMQKLFTDNLPRRVSLYNEFYALIVRVGKEYCKKKYAAVHGMSPQTIFAVIRRYADGSVQRRERKPCERIFVIQDTLLWITV